MKKFETEWFTKDDDDDGHWLKTIKLVDLMIQFLLILVPINNSILYQRKENNRYYNTVVIVVFIDEMILFFTISLCRFLS